MTPTKHDQPRLDEAEARLHRLMMVLGSPAEAAGSLQAAELLLKYVQLLKNGVLPEEVSFIG